MLAFSMELLEAFESEEKSMTFLSVECWFLFLSLALQGVAFAQLHEVGDGSFGPVKARMLRPS
jgi:hypothetical protein